MAITTGQRTSFQDRASVKDNISDRLDFLTPTDLPFLNFLGMMSEAGGAVGGASSLSFPCTQTRHTWLNDDLVPSVSSLYSAYTAAGGSIVVPDGESERFDVSEIVMFNDTVAVVTAINHSTDTLTITVIANDANGAAGDIVYSLGNARVEGTAASDITARTTDFGSTENFTQIFMDKVDMSGSEQSSERWGIDGDPYEYQVTKKLKEIAIRLEKAAIYGQRNSSYPSTNATRRYMGGLAYFVRDDATCATNGTVNDAAGADLDEIRLGDVLEKIWNQGGKPDVIMVPYRQKRVMNAWIEPNVRHGRDESTAGVLVGTYVSDAGSFDVVLNRWMKPSDLLILTREYIGIGPLAGNGNSRAFFREALPKDGDYDRDQIIGEYTMEVRNNTKAHGWIENLSTS